MNNEQKLAAAEAKLAAAKTARDDARAQLEQALATLKADGTEKARKAVLAAEDALRLASTELGWAEEAAEHARAEHEQAQHAARVAEYERAAHACSVEAFRTQAAPLAQRLAALARESAELAARGAELSAAFSSARTSLASSAREIGLTPAPLPEFAKIFGAESALAAGKTPADVLALFFGVEPSANVDAAAQLELAYQGQDPAEVTALITRLQEAETRRARSARQLLSEGSGIGSGASPTNYGSFQGVCAECAGYRQRLAELGFGAVADTIRADALADELASADTERVALLIDQYRVADFARANEELQRRDSKGHAAECCAIKAQLGKLGCANVVAALPRVRVANQGGLALGAF